MFSASATYLAAHSPACLTDVPSAAAWHSLRYVLPLHPQTGAAISVQTSTFGLHTPEASLTIAGQSPVRYAQSSPGPHPAPAIPPQSAPFFACAPAAATSTAKLSKRLRRMRPPDPRATELRYATESRDSPFKLAAKLASDRREDT
jgi:hypothetical protein